MAALCVIGGVIVSKIGVRRALLVRNYTSFRVYMLSQTKPARFLARVISCE